MGRSLGATSALPILGAVHWLSLGLAQGLFEDGARGHYRSPSDLEARSRFYGQEKQCHNWAGRQALPGDGGLAVTAVTAAIVPD